MLLRPYLLLYCKRLIVSAVMSLGCALLTLFMTSGRLMTSAGGDARKLLNPFLFASVLLSIILGVSSGFGVVPTPGFQGEVRFLLTRPTARRTLILQPLWLSALAFAILPGLAWLLVLGWLKLVHAPALDHLVALVEMVPSASTLGPHPSFISLMSALHMGRRFVAGLSVGLSLYAIFVSQRWLRLSRNQLLRALSWLIFLLFYLPMASVFISPSFFTPVFLTGLKNSDLSYLPSSLGITLHFVFAAAVLLGSWRLLRQVEL